MKLSDVAKGVGSIALVVFVVAMAGCKREPPLPAAAVAPPPPDPAVAEAAILAALPIHLDQPLGADLQVVGLSVKARPGGRSWEVALYSRVLHKKDPRPQLWVHAYPPKSHEYKIVEPTGNFPSADVGRLVKDGFILPGPGAVNLYAGVMGADGGYGPATSIGWVVVGDPASKEFKAGIDFLRSVNDPRIAAMTDQAQRDYPKGDADALAGRH